MCRACHLQNPEKAAVLANPDQMPRNNPKIGCKCVWVVGYNQKTEQASWIAGHPCDPCLRSFHRVLPVENEAAYMLVVDVYGNRYKVATQVIARAKSLEKSDS
jgi:hypothetical protein